MTESLEPLVESLGITEVGNVKVLMQAWPADIDHPVQTQFDYFTSADGVPSINNEDDAAVSATVCLPALKAELGSYDGYLVCCYSQHPLVQQIRSELRTVGLHDKIVSGIFECSIAACLQSININEKFGIVSTGQQWQAILGDAVADLLGSSSSSRYAGTETTGLNANELHAIPVDELNTRMKDATKRLLQRNVKAICLGCAGMAGLNEVVRDACIDFLGVDRGSRIKIIDGVVAGVSFVESALRARY